MSALSSLLRRAELEMYLPVFFFFFFLRFFASARCTLTLPSAASFSVSSLSSSFTSLSESDCCWFSRSYRLMLSCFLLLRFWLLVLLVS
uniref:Putative secreted peptide n=1 Tax=Anopheles braziliensis TaxID=58242 RepID=A0A2M3ZQM5_9DIPT